MLASPDVAVTGRSPVVTGNVNKGEESYVVGLAVMVPFSDRSVMSDVAFRGCARLPVDDFFLAPLRP